jgi:hypothetical protein
MPDNLRQLANIRRKTIRNRHFDVVTHTSLPLDWKLDKHLILKQN